MRPAYAPFSKTPGAFCTLPGTSLEVHAFPNKVVVEGVAEAEIDVPLEKFKIVQDLGRGCIWIGEKIKVMASEKEIVVGKQLFSQSGQCSLPKKKERLHLGVHKKQEFEGMWKRMLPEELVPLIYMLSQQVPKERGATLPSLEWECLLRESFTQFLTPIAKHYGIFSSWREKIRSLFFQQKENEIWFVPESPFPAGKMWDVQLDGGGELSFSWRKGQVYEIRMRGLTRDLSLHFPGGKEISIQGGDAFFSVRLASGDLWLACGDKCRRDPRLGPLAAAHGETP